MKRVIAAAALSALVLWGGFTIFVLWNDHYRWVIPEVTLEPDYPNWHMLMGKGGKLDEYWAIRSPGTRSYARVGIGLPWPVPVEHYDRIVVEVGQETGPRRMSVGWSRTMAVNPRTMMSLEAISATSASVETDWLRPRDGTVEFVMFELLGVGDAPFLIERIRLLPARLDFMEIQASLFGGWIRFSPWTQRSAHHTQASIQPVLVSPALAVGVWVVMSWLVFIAFAKLRLVAVFPVFLVLAACGWLALDARWQADLFSKGLRALDAFSGKSAEERRSADLDGALYEFMQELKDQVGSEQRRLFALGYGEYWRTRARYHGLPWSTRSTDKTLSHNWNRYLREGDLILALDAPYVSERRQPIRADHDYDFRKVFDAGEIFGVGSEVDTYSPMSVIEIGADERELIRSTDNDLPGRAFYRLSVQLRSLSGESSARLIVRWKNSEGERVTAAERVYQVSDDALKFYEVAFVVPRYQDVDFFVVTDSEKRMQAGQVQVQLIDDDELVWLQSHTRGPFLVARPILTDELHQAYELL